ncbi:MAG: hypothetical protein AAGF23_26455, partial [Acidobacteriota bacterium]
MRPLPHHLRLPLVLVFLAGLGPTALSAQPTPVGDDFQVNSYTTYGQFNASAAMDSSGQFVLVWAGSSFDQPEGTIIGRRFQSDGTAIGDDFEVSQNEVDYFTPPAVAARDDGAFLVVWNSFNVFGDFSQDIGGRVYAPDGSPVGGEIVVNSYTTAGQFDPAVGVLANGNFVVAWGSTGSVGTDTSIDSVQAQLLASDGSPVGDQFQVNTYTLFTQSDPAISPRPDGGFVIVWESNGSDAADTDGRSIQGQIFDASGGLVGGQFEVNSYTTNSQLDPSVSADGDGGFAVVWRGTGSFGTDTDDRSVLGQRFAADGQAIGGEIQINTYTTGRQDRAKVASLEDGEFVVTWLSYGSDLESGQSTQAAFFDADGSAIGTEFVVNAYTTGDQSTPTVASDGDRRFIFGWSSLESPGTDTDGAVLARRFQIFAVEGQVFLDANFYGIRGDSEPAV